MSERLMDSAAVATQLRRLARHHTAAPWLHGEVARRMAERLSVIRLQPERVVDWWGTLGGGSELLRTIYPQARQLVVEPTADWAALARAAHELPWWQPRRWTGAPVEVLLDEGALPQAQGAQLVWANMMLHAAVDPPALLARWQAMLASGGFVMFSCLGPDSLRQLRTLYRALGWPEPAAAFVDMHDLGDMMVQAGFADPVMDQELLTLHWASPEALLAELRSLGGNVASQRFAGLRTPRWRQRLLAALAEWQGADGRLGLSFEVAYGHAFKAGPRLKVGGETTVSLEDMRNMVRAPRGQG